MVTIWSQFSSLSFEMVNDAPVLHKLGCLIRKVYEVNLMLYPECDHLKLSLWQKSLPHRVSLIKKF
jgi:hypothetical protein